MNLFTLLNAMTATDSCDDEKDLTNFIHSLKFVDSLSNCMTLYKLLSTSTAIPDFDILPSFRSALLFADANDDERTLHQLNIRLASSAGDTMSIAKVLKDLNGINKVCSNYNIVGYDIKFIIK